MIVLRSVTRENIDELIALDVHDHQRGFVISVAGSLAKAYVYRDTAYPFGVYDGDTAVGFIMMGYYEAKGYYTLWEFLIDKAHQNKGIGREALKQGIEFLKDKFDVKEIYTGVAPGNAAAKHLYGSVGFEPTGLFELGMEEWRLRC